MCKLFGCYSKHEKSRCYESLAHDCEVQHTSSTTQNCILSTGISSVNTNGLFQKWELVELPILYGRLQITG